MSDKKPIEAKGKVLTQLLGVAQLIRKRGSVLEAEAILPYERQLEAEIAECNAKLAGNGVAA